MKQHTEKYLPLGFVFLGALLLITYFARPILDPDFFWHLKTGQWMLENKSLMAHDPMMIGGTANPNFHQRFILTSYWLAQVIYAALFSVFDWWGIALLRSILAAVLLFSVMKRVKRADWSTLFLLSVFSITIFGLYPIERPQFFSFVGFAILLLLLRTETFPHKKSRWLLPLSTFSLMVFWSNLHGGVMVGQCVLTVYGTFELFRLCCHGREKKSDLIFLLAVIAGLVGSVLNPIGLEYYQVYLMMFFDKPENLNLVGENISFWSDVASGNYMKVPALIIVFGGIIFFIRKGFKQHPVELFLLVCFAAAGFAQIRYVPFLMILAFSFAADGLSEASPSLRKVSRLLITATLLFQVAVYGRYELSNLTSLYVTGFVSENSLTPEAAANHILEKKPPGNMLNYYDWGGYLMFRMAPERKVFIDGRFMYPERLREYFTLFGSLPNPGVEPVDYFDDLVEKYDIGYLVIPKYVKTDTFLEVDIFWLAEWLSKSKDWEVSFYNFHSVVFVKKDYKKKNLSFIGSKELLND